MKKFLLGFLGGLVFAGLVTVLLVLGFLAAFSVSGNPPVVTDNSVLVLDLMMPVMDGFEFLQELRKFDDDIPVIFLTARSLDDDRLYGLNLGAVDLRSAAGDALDDAALIAALDDGHIAHATLDVFRVELF